MSEPKCCWCDNAASPEWNCCINPDCMNKELKIAKFTLELKRLESLRKN